MQAAAEAVGKKIAEICKEKNIQQVSFDRGGFAYHGRVKVGLTPFVERIFKLHMTDLS